MTTYNKALDNPFFLDTLKKYTIQVVAPASGIHPDKIRCLEELSSLKLDLSFISMSPELPYHSTDDEQRFQQLKTVLWDDSTNTLIWILRGGYGSARLIEKLQKLPPPTKKKYFIGFSDVTALHLFFSQEWQWQTIHGSGISQILDPNQDPENFIKIAEIIEKSSAQSKIPDLKPLNDEALEQKECQGLLTGGNLTLVENSIGTPWQVQTANKILFLEEVGEKGYRIDRSLHHLAQAGLLGALKAIVFGEFLNGADERDISIALNRFAKEIRIPVYQCSHFGHGNKNYPLLYNAYATISLNSIRQSYDLVMHL